MSKWLMVGVVCVMGLLAGCSMTETAKERQNRLCLITNLQSREAVEDWDVIWLYDRASRLSPWHVYAGNPRMP